MRVLRLTYQMEEREMTKKRRRNRPVYAAEVCLDRIYPDGTADASVARRHLGYFPSLASATEAVNGAKSEPEWTTGTVYYGFLWEPIPGVEPERFEMDDREPGWFIGTDGRPTQ